MQATAVRPTAPRVHRTTHRAQGRVTPRVGPTTTRPAVHTRRSRAGDARRTHLTRRGRIVILVLLVGVLLAAFSLGRVASQAAPSAGPASAVSYAQETVQPGESLWSVARRIAPDNDPREVIAQIRRINGLSSSQIRVGQQLLLPVSA